MYPINVRQGPYGLCGYVGVPKSHPWWGKDYTDYVDVPDRVRFRKNPEIGILDVFYMNLEDFNKGRLSISLAVDVHGGLTYSDDSVPGGKPDGRWWFGFDCGYSGDTLAYWTEERVREETERLAKQLEEMADAEADQ